MNLNGFTKAYRQRALVTRAAEAFDLIEQCPRIYFYSESLCKNGAVQSILVVKFPGISHAITCYMEWAVIGDERVVTSSMTGPIK